MSKGVKILLAVALTFAVLLIGSGMLLAATVVRGGMVTVKVNEPGNRNIHLVLPAGLLSLGVDLLPLVAGHDLAAEIRTDLDEYGPAMAAALLELEDAPDAVLVDVQDGRESVRILKEGRSLEIHVQGPEGTFEISLPARLLGKIAREIA